MIIDIEGTDGCGKKTQTELLYMFLQEKGYKVKMISFPNYESKSSMLVRMFLNGEFGDTIDCLNGYQASVLYSVDRFDTMSKINVNDYDYILFDRYVPSNMIHQSTRIKKKKELNKFLKWVEDFEYVKMRLPRPDSIIFLDMPVEQSFNLAQSRTVLKNGQSKDILENKQHLIEAYNNAKYVAKKYNWTTINCFDKDLKSIDEIHEEILTKLNLK